MTATLPDSLDAGPSPEHERLRRDILHGELAGLGAEVDGLRADLDTVLAEVDAHRAESERLRADLRIVAAERDAVLADRDLVSADRELIRAERDALHTDREAVAAERDNMRGELEAVLADREAIAQIRDALLADREAIARSRDTLSADRAALLAGRAELEAACAALTHDRDLLRSELQREIDRQQRVIDSQADQLRRQREERRRADVVAGERHGHRRSAAADAYDRELREQSLRRQTAGQHAELVRLRDWIAAAAVHRQTDRVQVALLAAELDATRRTVSWRVTRSLRSVRRLGIALGLARPAARQQVTSAPVDPVPRLAVPVAVEFDPAHYRVRHADLATLDDAALLEHYRRHGRQEGRIATSWLRRCLVTSGLDRDDRERVLVVLPDGGTTGLDLVRELDAWYHVVVLLQRDGESAWQFDENAGTTIVLDDSRLLAGEEASVLARELAVLTAPRFAVTWSAECHRLATALEEADVPVVAVVPEDAAAAERWGSLDRFFATVSEVVHPTVAVAESLTTRVGAARGRGYSLAGPGGPDAELLDRVGRRAARVRSHQARELRTILTPGGFDGALFAGQNATAEREVDARRYLRRVQAAAPLQRPDSGLLVRRPRAGFHPLAYAESAPDFDDTGADPFAHYLAAGRPAGRWARRVLTPQPARTAPQHLDVLVHGHFHYPDLLPDFLDRLAGNRFRHTLVLTATTPRAVDELSRLALDHPAGAGAEVLLVPNRGRNLSALLSGAVAEQVRSADLVLHVHGKRSPHLDRAFGRRWRDHLWSHLVGAGTPFADQIVAEFAAVPELGLVAPEEPVLHDWYANRKPAEDLLTRLGRTMDLPTHFDFPVGAMFWARSAALRPFLDAELGDSDYPAEPLAPDGTWLHALERLLPLVVEADGYEFAKTYLL